MIKKRKSKKVLVLIGRPGAGKGLISDFLGKKYPLTYLSTGNLCREQITKKTSIGKAIQSIISKGDLIATATILKLFQKKFIEVEGNILIDGFPRTWYQQLSFEILATKYDFDFHYLILDCPEKVCLERLKTRLICSQCQKVYNLKTDKPKIANQCDNDQKVLIYRKDDQFKAQKRMDVFTNQTQPLIDDIKKKNFDKMLIVDTNQDIIKIFNFLEKNLNFFKNN